MTISQMIGRSILFTIWLAMVTGMVVVLPVTLVYLIIYFDHLAVKAMASIVATIYLIVVGAGLS